jgi:U3 small nucleolar RNA-associated protein 23
MKIKRHKHTKRVLKYYETNFNFDTKNVNILIDGTFANEALKSKINLADQMPKYFDIPSKKCRLLTTKCALNETQLLGKATYGAMLILKQYELVECVHKRQFVSSEKCFKNILLDSQTGNDNQKYFVATQVNKFISLVL